MAAERKPDFSGEYVLNSRASALSGGAAAVQSAVLRFDHREPTVRSLRLEAVQMELFGRRLAGTPDALPGLELGALKIDDEAVVAIKRTDPSHHGHVHRTPV